MAKRKFTKEDKLKIVKEATQQGGKPAGLQSPVLQHERTILKGECPLDIH